MIPHQKLIIHPSAHPQVFLAGGNFLGKDSLGRFDGLIIFAMGGGFHFAALDAVNDGTIKVPFRFHGSMTDEYSPGNLPAVVKQDLEILARQGCRRIGMHTMHDLSRAKASVRATVEWLNTNPGSIDTVTFVDWEDDYYNCFGLDPFGTVRGSMVNLEPTAFESYFEKRFRQDLEFEFPVSGKGGFPCCIVERRKAEKRLFLFPQPEFSVSLFYLSLIPQAIAKVCGSEDAMYAFSRLADWPLLDLMMGGWMAPGEYLDHMDMLPGPGAAEEWLKCAEAEYGYFCRVITHYMISGIREPGNADEERLGRRGEGAAQTIHREVRAYLTEFADYLKGGPRPNNYYLPEEFRRGSREDER